MKKYLILFFLLLSFIFPKDISPIISIRYDKMDEDEAIVVTDAIGLKFDLGKSRSTGFDTDGTDHRIYLGWSFGKIGLGHDGTNAEYTVGGSYEMVDNIGIDIDYVMGDNSDNLRLALNITF